jgi:Ni/Co efflux regulator RcnB
MKRLMTLMLALSFLGATVAVSFADEPKQDTGKKKKGKKKKTDENKAVVR